jgi:hypothetical protein
VPIQRIDRRLGELDDRSLIIALYQLGWAGLVTNNYKMLYVPAEIAAIVKTKLLVFAIQGAGHDPFRATGALPSFPRKSGSATTNWSVPCWEPRIKRAARGRPVTCAEVHRRRSAA